MKSNKLLEELLQGVLNNKQRGLDDGEENYWEVVSVGSD